MYDECKENKTVRHCEYYFLGVLEFCNFYFSWEFSFIYTADNFVVLLVWQLKVHTLSCSSKQVLVIGYVWVHFRMLKNEGGKEEECKD
jgi:hypothetical protein